MIDKTNKNDGVSGLDHEETDLIGFDGLWDVDYKETRDFLKSRKNFKNSEDNLEFELLHKELEEKNFEIQKLEWQLSEREKELGQAYDELHKLIELNRKLNKQLSDFEALSEKQDALLQLLENNSKKLSEPILPKFK